MTLMRAATVDGMVLTYDTDDVEDMHIEAPHDVIDRTPPFATHRHRELGQAHLVVRIDFKPGKDAYWADRATAALPDLRVGGEILRTALDAENIPAEAASRIWNRFFFGEPDGLAGKPFPPSLPPFVADPRLTTESPDA